MAVIDNRTLLADAESLAPGADEWSDEAGGTMSIALDTDTFIQGSSSIADRGSASRIGIFFKESVVKDRTNTVYYIWWRCDVAGKLSTKAEGGITIRFTGAAITDWFEVYVEGSDTYGGGFVMTVIDIELARAQAVTGAAQSPNLVGNTGGTPPAITDIGGVGVMYDVLTSAPGSADNCFVDAIWTIDRNEPAIIVEGNAGGSPEVPYTWADILPAGDNADSTKAWGMISQSDGIVKLNAPIRFGTRRSPDLGNQLFSDTTTIIAFETQLVTDEFYKISVIGDGLNTHLFKAGTELGGAGLLGWVITSADDGPRWNLDLSDPQIEDASLNGCTFIHSNKIKVSNSNVTVLNCQFINGLRLIQSERNPSIF